MRGITLLGVLITGILTNTGAQAVAESPKFDKKLEKATLDRLKQAVEADLRGTIVSDPSQQQSADNKRTLELQSDPKPTRSSPKPPAIKPIVSVTPEAAPQLDRTVTGSIPKVPPLIIWERFDSEGNFISPYPND